MTQPKTASKHTKGPWNIQEVTKVRELCAAVEENTRLSPNRMERILDLGKRHGIAAAIAAACQGVGAEIRQLAFASSPYKIRCEGETWKVETRADGLLVKKGLELRDAVQLVKSLEYDMENLS